MEISSVESFYLNLSETIIPPNHNCKTPRSLGLPSSSITPVLGSTVNATDNIDLSKYKCTNERDVHAQVIWYNITGNGSKLKVSTCSNRTDFHAQLFLLEGYYCLPFDDSFVRRRSCQTGTRDESCQTGKLSSSIEWISHDGITYLLAVGGNSIMGNFELHLSEVTPLTRDNEECSKAYQIELPEPISSSIMSNTSVLGSIDGADNRNFAWYRVAGTGGKMVASTCSDFTSVPTNLSLHDSCDTTASPIGVSEDNNNCTIVGWSKYSTSRLEWDSKLNVLYFIRVAILEPNSTGGDFELTLFPD